MASFKKYQASDIGRLFLHNNRRAGDGVTHANENIDDQKTVLNYYIKKGSAEDVSKRIENIFHNKRKDRVVLGEMLVTLPEDVKKEDEREFFKAVYKFYSEDFGEENIINAVVHKDEITPHIHLDFIPVVKAEIKGEARQEKSIFNKWKEVHGEEPDEKLCCRDLITQSYLKEMHPRLSEYVKKQLGYEVSIMNGKTINGNRTIAELKYQELLSEIEEQKKKKKNIEQEILDIIEGMKKYGLVPEDLQISPMLQKIDDLENQNAVLRQVISRNNFKWKQEDFNQIAQKKYKPSEASKISYYAGRLQDNISSLEQDNVVVIYIPPTSIPSPQEKILKFSSEIKGFERLAQASKKIVTVKSSKSMNQTICLVKIGKEEKDMSEALMAFEQEIINNQTLKKKRFYVEKAEQDDYDIMRAILEKNNITASYYRPVEESKTKDTNENGKDEKNSPAMSL